MVAYYRFSGTAEPTEIRNIAKRFEPLLLVYVSVLRALQPAGEMCAIAQSMPPYARPRQERRRHTPSFFAAGANGKNLRQ
jgi:hypothetical protein